MPAIFIPYHIKTDCGIINLVIENKYKRLPNGFSWQWGPEDTKILLDDDHTFLIWLIRENWHRNRRKYVLTCDQLVYTFVQSGKISRRFFKTLYFKYLCTNYYKFLIKYIY